MSESKEERVLSQIVAEAGLGRIEEISPLRAHGSARRIYRIFLADGFTVVGIWNDAHEENAAFIDFARAFLGIGLRVPRIYSPTYPAAYIETDLGDVTLMDSLVSARAAGEISQTVRGHYERALEDLVVFQVQGLGVIDPELCYQGARFDGDAIELDVRYFQEQYLARSVGAESKHELDADICELRQYGEKYLRGFFMYRDFQSRNIMIRDNEPWYIDFQSGREGPLQYDVASLLFQSQADLPYRLREELLDHYIETLAEFIDFDERDFRNDFYVYVLIRALQNLGAYGKLGLGQGKKYFRESIPFALANCRYLLNKWPETLDCPTLRNRIEKIVENDKS
ncbi:aminoglycoside phosphotransferase family protein [Lentisalinibacter orientalis]|uniref:aminoglycoside phosphotransferase family protein n=1 Tax=Lentisalinibacter orientalis TaxID=2992241 RepID=UPI003865DE8B